MRHGVYATLLYVLWWMPEVYKYIRIKYSMLSQDDYVHNKESKRMDES